MGAKKLLKSTVRFDFLLASQAAGGL